MEDRTKVAPATNECTRCKKWIYKGTSQKNFEELISQHPKKVIEKGRLEIDHTEPTISLQKGWVFSYDDYIKRLFCGPEGLVGLCKSCHLKKSNLEKEIRKSENNSKELREAWKAYNKFVSEYLDE